MTFAEWRTKYSGINVHELGGGVALVSDYLLPNGPLQDLKNLSDYVVTREAIQAHYGPTVWVAPRSKGPWNRDDYMDGKIDHETYYCFLGDAIGRKALESLVLHVAPLDKLIACFSGDRNLNNIPLQKWDAMHEFVRRMVSHQHMAISWSARAQAAGGQSAIQLGQICWSLSESVCVLKAIARRMVEEAKHETHDHDQTR
jgi:hypothetical protein